MAGGNSPRDWAVESNGGDVFQLGNASWRVIRIEPGVVRVAEADETARFTEIVMDVFRMPRRFYPALLDMTDAWRRAGATLYFAEVDGEPVATTLLAKTDGVAGPATLGALTAPPPTIPLPLAWPMTAPVLGDRFGPRGDRWHSGIDLPAPMGAPVYSAQSGRVAGAG